MYMVHPSAIPPYTKGKHQPSRGEVALRYLLCVKMHVERAIGKVKHYRILQSTLQITLIKRASDSEYASTCINKILMACAALSNLRPPLSFSIQCGMYGKTGTPEQPKQSESWKNSKYNEWTTFKTNVPLYM